MNEGEIRMDARKWALVADMYALNAVMSGMIATNRQVEIQGYSPAYTDGQFEKVETEFKDIASRLRTEI